MKEEASTACCELITLPGPHVYPSSPLCRGVPLVAARAAPAVVCFLRAVAARSAAISARRRSSSPRRCSLRRCVAALALALAASRCLLRPRARRACVCAVALSFEAESAAAWRWTVVNALPGRDAPALQRAPAWSDAPAWRCVPLVAVRAVPAFARTLGAVAARGAAASARGRRRFPCLRAANSLRRRRSSVWISCSQSSVVEAPTRFRGASSCASPRTCLVPRPPMTRALCFSVVRCAFFEFLAPIPDTWPWDRRPLRCGNWIVVYAKESTPNDDKDWLACS